MRKNMHCTLYEMPYVKQIVKIKANELKWLWLGEMKNKTKKNKNEISIYNVKS